MLRCRCALPRRYWRLSLYVISSVLVCCLIYLIYVSIKLLHQPHGPHSGLLAGKEFVSMTDGFAQVGDVEEIVFPGADPIPEQDAVFIDGDLRSEITGMGNLRNPSFQLPLSEIEKTESIVIENSLSVAQPSGSADGRFLFIYGHYEQLGKATVNFMHAASIAAQSNRKIVVPFVRHSRFCGLKEGWTGEKRKKSREFLPMENYFQMSSVIRLFQVHHLAQLAGFSEFTEHCSASHNQELTVLYFIYLSIPLQRYLRLDDIEYSTITEKMAASSGWIDCSFIEKKLRMGPRIPQVKIGRQYCVDAELVTSIDTLENDILAKNRCAAILYWRGVGYQRTHFQVNPISNYGLHLSKLELSHVVKSEADLFISRNFGAQKYLSIQIRSERQLSWYGWEKFAKCMELVTKVAKIIMHKRKLNTVFLSSDLGSYGSDVMTGLLNQSTLTRAEELVSTTMKSLNGVTLSGQKRKGLIYNDNGFVALTQMEIMSRSHHLITLGNGTFQQWLVGLFKRYKVHKLWSISRVCSQELKNPVSKPKTQEPQILRKFTAPVKVKNEIPFR